ncbi:MAG: hypothetical protein RL156_737 [Bacteroidota bacterium]|jgi:hypothetical protein
MTTESSDQQYVYSPDHLLEQAKHTPLVQGYHILEFCVDEHGQLAKHPTEKRSQFYYSPSGGTLRDTNMNIVLYSARFDKFKGIGKEE